MMDLEQEFRDGDWCRIAEAVEQETGAKLDEAGSRYVFDQLPTCIQDCAWVNGLNDTVFGDLVCEWLR